MWKLRREIFWAAGLIEGEGSFCAHRPGPENRPGKGKNRGLPRFEISVEMVDREPLELLQGFFGGTLRRRPQRKPNWSPTHVWYLGGPRALALAFTLYTLFSPRRQRQIREKVTLCLG